MDYFKYLEDETHKLYDIANEARGKGLDIELKTEIPLAKDLAERVEGLVGPEGVAKRIKKLENEDMNREELAFQITAEIASQPLEKDNFEEREKLADQGLRTGLAILTEGVVAAPLEGIAKVKIKDNYDGTKYLAVYFAGPIRSAGGTAAALAILLGDRIREAINISKYKPIEAEIERYVEEVELYESEVTNLQYSTKPDEIRTAAANIPVEVTGEPTDQVEVSHRDLERVETNNIRGGALLAMVEGILQKAPKVIKYSKTLNLDSWEWLKSFVKMDIKEETSEEDEVQEEEVQKISVDTDAKYVSDIIGGRPVLGYPSEKGAFRLRYGRSRNTGLAAMGVHPATMELLEFIAVGTQLKIERPGKGTCVVPVDSIEGPVVKLKNGDVLKISSVQDAKAVKGKVDEILFLGDMLVAFGEFLRNNQLLLPSAWCGEWWLEEIKNSDKYMGEDLPSESISAKESFEVSNSYSVALNPLYTYNYQDISIDDLTSLIKVLAIYLSEFDSVENFLNEEISLSMDILPEKRILEILLVPHIINEDKLTIAEDDSYALAKTLLSWIDESTLKEIKEDSKQDKLSFIRNLSNEEFKNKYGFDFSSKDTLSLINLIAPVEIYAKSPTYIGSRVGRPEKSKERLMRPAPNSLFPIGTNGGSKRNILEAAKKGTIRVDVSRFKCPECGVTSFKSSCPECGTKTELTEPANINLNLAKIVKKGFENVNVRKLDEVKGVQGMISESKFPEPIEKGILRAKNQVFTFKDATIRHDSTDLPLTHFIPREIGVSYEKIIELGYEEDAYGNPITNDEQVIELKVQDVVISDNCGEYLVNVANFIDDLLVNYYGMEAFYNVKRKEDLVGHLIAGLAPHTSAAVLGRVIGFTKALACYAHPYFHSAKRRNCDSDEDSVLLLLDALLNFSKSYLPSTRGGTMDAPLVLSSRIDPEEIDDESHKIDIMSDFSLDFFKSTLDYKKPSEVLDLIDNVGKHLGTPEQYSGLMFSHNTSSIHAGPKICLYKTLPSMKEKVEGQIKLAELIRAVDQRAVVEGVLSSHFIPDMMGNTRAFSKQKVRCTKCNRKYRRIPITGRCSCGNDLILSVSQGSVTKYLDISKELAKKYPISNYLMQRIDIIEYGMNSLFESDKSKQSSLDVFL